MTASAAVVSGALLSSALDSWAAVSFGAYVCAAVVGAWVACAVVGAGDVETLHAASIEAIAAAVNREIIFFIVICLLKDV